MEKSFRVGISGTGTIGKIHAEALGRIPEATVVAVAEPRIEAGKAFAEKYGAQHFASLPEMLEGAEIDVVIVTTPSGLHPDQAVMAAEKGKHVITEKPMAITRDGLDRMISAAESHGVQLAVIFQNRLHPDVLRMRHAIATGVLGRPIMANGTMYWHRSDEYYAENGGWRGTWSLDGGGALMNQAIHTVDQLQWLMDGVTSVQAHIGTLGHTIETEDAATASFVYGNGGLGTIIATTCAHKDYPIRVEIIGTKGRATLENNKLSVWECDTPFEDVALPPEDQALLENWSENEEWGDAHQRQLSLMLKAFANGSPAFVPGIDARIPVDIILAIYESAKNGTRVLVGKKDEA